MVETLEQRAARTQASDSARLANVLLRFESERIIRDLQSEKLRLAAAVERKAYALIEPDWRYAKGS